MLLPPCRRHRFPRHDKSFRNTPRAARYLRDMARCFYSCADAIRAPLRRRCENIRHDGLMRKRPLELSYFLSPLR